MKFKLFALYALVTLIAAGCSDSQGNKEIQDPDDPQIDDPDNPDDPDIPDGMCGNKCGVNSKCNNGVCECETGFSDCDGNNTCETEGECICHLGDTMPCYSGNSNTENVGICHGGVLHCLVDEEYGADWDYVCDGEQVPYMYPICNKEDPKSDSDCNGIPDYLQDSDEDGFAACSSFGTVIDCCDSKMMCNTESPEFVNPNKLIDCKGNNLDDDCDGDIDEDDILCETGKFAENKCTLNERNCDSSFDTISDWTTQVKSGQAALSMARSMNLCMDVVSVSSGKAGIIEYSLTKASSDGPSSIMVNPGQVAILGGMNSKESMNMVYLPPRVGSSFLMLSTGEAKDAKNVSEIDKEWESSTQSVVPSLYLKAHHNKLQSHKSCGFGGSYIGICDSAVLHFKLRAPTTALGFSFDFRFFSREYPYYVCSDFNDFFITVVTDEDGAPFVDTNGDNSILDEDGNISFDKQGNAVSVNNAFFTTCAAPECGDTDAMGQISKNSCPAITTCSENNTCGTCEDGYADLYAYYPSPYTGSGSGISTRGGGTAWLTTNVPVNPGQIFNLDFYIWDTGDCIFDSSVIIDNFRWNCTETVVGTDFAKPIEEIN